MNGQRRKGRAAGPVRCGGAENAAIGAGIIVNRAEYQQHACDTSRILRRVDGKSRRSLYLRAVRAVRIRLGVLSRTSKPLVPG